MFCLSKKNSFWIKFELFCQCFCFPSWVDRKCKAAHAYSRQKSEQPISIAMGTSMTFGPSKIKSMVLPFFLNYGAPLWLCISILPDIILFNCHLVLHWVINCPFRNPWWDRIEIYWSNIWLWNNKDHSLISASIRFQWVWMNIDGVVIFFKSQKLLRMYGSWRERPQNSSIWGRSPYSPYILCIFWDFWKITTQPIVIQTRWNVVIVLIETMVYCFRVNLKIWWILKGQLVNELQYKAICNVCICHLSRSIISIKLLGE